MHQKDVLTVNIVDNEFGSEVAENRCKDAAHISSDNSNAFAVAELVNLDGFSLRNIGQDYHLERQANNFVRTFYFEQQPYPKLTTVKICLLRLYDICLLPHLPGTCSESLLTGSPDWQTLSLQG